MVFLFHIPSGLDFLLCLSAREHENAGYNGALCDRDTYSQGSKLRKISHYQRIIIFIHFQLGPYVA